MRSIILVLLTAATIYAQSGASHFTATSANVSGAGESIRINLTQWSTDIQRDELVAAWTLTATTAPQGRGGRGGAGGAGRGGAGAATGRGGAGRGARGGDAAAAAAPAPAAAITPAPALDVPPDPDAVGLDPAPARGRGGARGGGGGGGGNATQTPEGSLAAALKKAPTVGILWTTENVGYSIKYAYRLAQPDGSERVILATDRRIGMWSNLWKPAASVTPADYTFSIIELHLNARGEGEGKGVLSGKVAVDSTVKTIAVESYTTLPVILKGVKRQSGN